MASEKAGILPSDSETTPDTPPLLASCHCGRVTLELPHLPEKLNDCHCTICYKYGALWAYYPRDTVKVAISDTDKDGPLEETYLRSDTDSAWRILFQRCGRCGCVTHWLYAKAASRNKMGVNARMLPEEVIEGVEKEYNKC